MSVLLGRCCWCASEMIIGISPRVLPLDIGPGWLLSAVRAQILYNVPETRYRMVEICEDHCIVTPSFDG